MEVGETSDKLLAGTRARGWRGATRGEEPDRRPRASPGAGDGKEHSFEHWATSTYDLSASQDLPGNTN